MNEKILMYCLLVGLVLILGGLVGCGQAATSTPTATARVGNPPSATVMAGLTPSAVVIAATTATTSVPPNPTATAKAQGENTPTVKVSVGTTPTAGAQSGSTPTPRVSTGNTPTTGVADGVEVTMNRTGGLAPTTLEVKASTVTGSWTVVFQNTTKQSTLTKEQSDALNKAVRSVLAAPLKENYGGNAADAYRFRIQITEGNQSKTIQGDQTVLPKETDDLLIALGQIAKQGGGY